MKKTTGLFLGLTVVIIMAGCQKKEVYAPVEEPIVTEETSATALANLEMSGVALTNSMNTAVPVEPSALEAAATGVVEQVATIVVENPSPQQIQEALKSAGYYEGSVDGNIGPKTKRAIEKFQTDNGLKADGKVGPKTWTKLGTYLVRGDGAGSSAIAPVTEPILGNDAASMNDEAVTK